jgi:hypothetical protein
VIYRATIESDQALGPAYWLDQRTGRLFTVLNRGETWRIVRIGPEQPLGLLHVACGLVSFSPYDVSHRYCGRCHMFLDRPGRLRGRQRRARRDPAGAHVRHRADAAQRQDDDAPRDRRALSGRRALAFVTKRGEDFDGRRIRPYLPREGDQPIHWRLVETILASRSASAA